MRLDLHIHVHHADDSINRILSLLQAIQAQGAKIMAIGTETQNVLNKLNDATNAVAARLQTLIDAADLSDEEKAGFQTVIDHLNALATDPTNPAPPLPPA